MAVTVRTVRRPQRSFATQIYLIEVWKGLAVTFRHLFVNLARHTRRQLGWGGPEGSVTIQYPDDPAMLGKRVRATGCLSATTARRAARLAYSARRSARQVHPHHRRGKPEVVVEKRAKSFDIDIGMCVFCGYCVEACPVDAIHMDANKVELSSYTRQDMIWNMSELLGDSGKGKATS